MAQITLKGNPITAVGELPAVGSKAPDFKLTKTDLSDVTMKDFAGKTLVLNIFVSLDTSTCAASVRRFNAEASKLPNTVVLCISADLPFAHQRFCETDGLKDVVSLSVVRSPEFGKDYGVTMTSGPLTGFLSRSVVVVDSSGKIVYTEQVPEISQEPDYDEALRTISALAK